ncbi:hypothetical protein [Sinorhizobium psoraleae]|uniref:Transposase n=1 Tax=Sinorhizobium psoraleae TaxID=520838 RepID=A0ABT4KNF9_9HYPH|nr:hypothetical protein [Sinorhizobium psoraleae]MCZ4093384.1 hypothetical protein [Sinorhizobium psoraleae]
MTTADYSAAFETRAVRGRNHLGCLSPKSPAKKVIAQVELEARSASDEV